MVDLSLKELSVVHSCGFIFLPAASNQHQHSKPTIISWCAMNFVFVCITCKMSEIHNFGEFHHTGGFDSLTWIILLWKWGVYY